MKKNEFNKQYEQRDIIQEMDEHLKNLHESDEEEVSFQNQQLNIDSKNVQKVLQLMLKLYSRHDNQTYQTKKCFYFYLWKYSQNLNIFETNWLNTQQQLQQQRRYPYSKMKRERQKIEEQIFDLERKYFYQNRQKQILITVLKNAARRERLIKTIAFHKFIRNVALINFQSTSKFNSSQNTFKPAIQSIPIQQNYQKENKSRNRSKSPISTNNSKQSLTSKQQHLRNRSLFAILSYLTKVNEKENNKKLLYFYKWFKTMSQIRQLEQIEEIQQINLILNQIVLKENVFRTKISLIKSEIDSKTYLAQEMLNTVLK